MRKRVFLSLLVHDCQDRKSLQSVRSVLLNTFNCRSIDMVSELYFACIYCLLPNLTVRRTAMLLSNSLLMSTLRCHLLAKTGKLPKSSK